MGIWDMLQTLHQKSNVLWKYMNGNINTYDVASTHVMNTEVRASNSSSTEAENQNQNPESYIARYPTLRYYASSQLRVGRKIAGGTQAEIYEAELASTFSNKLLPVIVKKFNVFYGIVSGLFPLEFVTYKNMYVCKPTGFFFDSKRSLCMIMDRYSRDLRDLIDAKMKLRHDDGPPFTEPVAVSIIMQLALGLRCLHGTGIHHKDIKGKNILVEEKLENLLIPSGASLEMNFAIAISDFEISDPVFGSGMWRAPEIFQDLKVHKDLSGIQWEKADVYSFGMTCFEILSGKIPFQGHEFPRARDVVLSGGRPELPAHVPQGLKDIIQRCWRHDPNDRPTIAEIIPLLKEEYELLWAIGFRKVESVMNWESSLATSDAVLLELVQLVRLVVTDTPANTTDHKLKRHRKIASKFVCTAERFVHTAERFESDFGWGSFAKHPSMPFAKLVEREGLYTLMASHYTEECDIYYEFIHCKNAAFERKTRIVLLMETLFFTVADGAWRSMYSGQDDEGLMLSDKLSIILKAFVEPLLSAGVKKPLIFKVAKRLLQVELSRQYHQEENIERFRIRFMISISPLLLPECVVRLQDIVGFPVVEFLTEHIFSFPFMRILLRRVFTEHELWTVSLS